MAASANQPAMPMYTSDQDAYLRQMYEWHNQMVQFHEQQRAYHLERTRYYQQLMNGSDLGQSMSRRSVV